MTVSMYQASVPALVRGLNNLSAILDKAAADAAARNIAPEVLLNARLAPDMFALTRQVQIASDSAKGCVARLAGVEVPSYTDDEASFADLQQRIAKTVAYVQSFDAARLDGSEAREVVLKVRGDEIRFSGQNYLLGFVLPNFYFHITAAYAILRHNGVALGKMDYLGGV